MVAPCVKRKRLNALRIAEEAAAATQESEEAVRLAEQKEVADAKKLAVRAATVAAKVAAAKPGRPRRVRKEEE